MMAELTYIPTSRTQSFLSPFPPWRMQESGEEPQRQSDLQASENEAVYRELEATRASGAGREGESGWVTAGPESSGGGGVGGVLLGFPARETSQEPGGVCYAMAVSGPGSPTPVSLRDEIVCNHRQMSPLPSGLNQGRGPFLLVPVSQSGIKTRRARG